MIELKSRRNEKNKYPDTMIGLNKITCAINEYDTKKFIFAFNFIDGLYYYEFNKDDMANGNIRKGTGGRCDRGKAEYSQYCYIKNDILIKIEETTSPVGHYV